MRELKFRAWAEVDGIKSSCTDMMVYFEPMQCDNGMWFNAPDKVYHINEYHSLMQFTGLQDKNGTDIYEGDIVRRSISGATPTRTDEVYFNKGSFVIGAGDFIKPLNHFYTLEVIGNIHETLLNDL